MAGGHVDKAPAPALLDDPGVKPIRTGRARTPGQQGGHRPGPITSETVIGGDMSLSWNVSLVPRRRFTIHRTQENTSLTCRSTEPPIGIEPMTYALRGARPPSRTRVSCTDTTGHRTDGTRRAGTIQGHVPRTVPRLRPCVTQFCSLYGTSLSAASRVHERVPGRQWADG